MSAADPAHRANQLQTWRVQIVSVDPRDQRAEIQNPTYRVYFRSEDGRRSDEYEVTGAESVTEVLQWSESEAGARSVVVYLAIPADGMTLARLHTSRPDAQ